MKIIYIIALFVLAGCTVPVSEINLPANINQNIQQEIIEENNKLIEPVAEFKQRITKKPFGIFINPATSPVQPERFSGYHTGVDVEYQDVADIIPVKAIADGQVVYSQWVSGYGGVMIIRHNIDNTDYLVLYGHLDPDNLLTANIQVIAGQDISFLGRGETHQTDGERQHLHFAVYKNTDINLRGYVQVQVELEAWLDPLELFTNP